MRPPPPPPEQDAPDPRLASLIDALPREAPPPAGVWTRVVIETRATRRRARWRPVLAAAALGVVLLGGRQLWTRDRAPSVTSTTTTTSMSTKASTPPPLIRTVALLPEETADPRLRAALQELEAWHLAADDVRRSEGWPDAARDAVLDAVRTTEAEMAQLRQALAAASRTEASRRQLLERLHELRAVQLDQLQRARALLDQL